MACFLALDQGGHASRAILFDERGRKVDEAFRPIGTRREGSDRVEHDGDELVASLEACIVEVTGRHHDIAAAGLATQRSSMVCWDKRDGKPLSPVLSWQDRRHAAWLAQFEPRGAWIRERTGLVLTPHYGASKMRWCLDNLPAVSEAARRGRLAMGPLASFLAHRLVRERVFVSDPANAARTQLWDLHTRDWSPELVELFGVPRDCLPLSVTSRFDYGTLAAGRESIPLTVVTGDQSAVPFAFGALYPAAAYVNVGTGAFAQRAVHGRMPHAPRLLASVVWSDRQGLDYMLEGTVNGGGSALDWLAAEDRVDIASLLAGADAPDQAEPPLFMNTVSGLGSPYWRSAGPPRFVGEGDAVARLTGVVESIAFLLAVNLEELAPHGPPLERIVLTGGFASNRAFLRRLAALAGVRVWCSVEQEATARGLARLVAAPAEPWDAGPGEWLEPLRDPALHARYARWRQLLESMIALQA
ncbi:MAG: hypothetical protein FJ197_04465 [Gammaproteobacteria bacterium]|nr:hypothetical protein [Gammaproteobacteria bacterium]